MILSLALGVALAVNPAPQFREHVIAEDLKGAYQVVAVDLNK
ncbi:MAG: VCBS repeat-containing protein, partial [Acidobacteriales bacterium]